MESREYNETRPTRKVNTESRKVGMHNLLVFWLVYLLQFYHYTTV